MSVSTSARPSSVHTAWILWLVFLGLSVVSLIVSVATTDGGGGAIGLGGVILVAVAACANKFRDGANWARIVLTILGVLNIVANVGLMAMLLGSGSVGDVPAVALVLSVLLPLVALAAVVLGFTREANAFFGSARTSRA